MSVSHRRVLLAAGVLAALPVIAFAQTAPAPADAPAAAPPAAAPAADAATPAKAKPAHAGHHKKKAATGVAPGKADAPSVVSAPRPVGG
jgi:hypothetical protein